MVDLFKRNSYDSGGVWKILDHQEAAFVPAYAAENDLPFKLIHVARSSTTSTHYNVAIFRDKRARDPLARANLWGTLHDRLSISETLNFRAYIDDNCRRAGVPAIVAGEGMAATATYLAAHDFDNASIAAALDVGSRTVSQYISDFKAGER